jgi:hypothetical protein
MIYSTNIIDNDHLSDINQFLTLQDEFSKYKITALRTKKLLEDEIIKLKNEIKSV